MRENLEKMRQRREEIIDESSGVMDGQPRAKYKVTDMVTNKVIRREQLDFTIKKMEYEINTIQEFQKSLTGYERDVYNETIAKQSNLLAKADLMGIGKTKLCEDRGKLLRQVATRLGEFIEDDKI